MTTEVPIDELLTGGTGAAEVFVYLQHTGVESVSKESNSVVQVYQCAELLIWERIWEKGPIGNVFTNLVAEKLPFQMLQTILKYS